MSAWVDAMVGAGRGGGEALLEGAGTRVQEGAETCFIIANY